MGWPIRRGAENDKGQHRHQDQNPSGPSATMSRSRPDFDNLFLIVLHTTMKSPLVSPSSTVRPVLIESSMAKPSAQVGDALWTAQTQLLIR